VGLPSKCRVNSYNPLLLRIWQANMDIQPVSNPFAAIAYMLGYITKDEMSEREAVKEALGKMPPSASTLQLLTKMGNAILSFREVSKEETMMLLLGEPLIFTSVATVFIPAFPPDQRHKSTVSRQVLLKKNPGSKEVWQQTIIDHYMRRPRGNLWDSLSLYEFASWFQVDGKVEGEGPDGETWAGEEPEDSAQEPTEPGEDREGKYTENPRWRENAAETPFIKKEGESASKLPRYRLLGCNTQIRMRHHPRCVRTPIAGATNLTSKYALLACNVPFRDELQDLLGVPKETEVTEELVDQALERFQEAIEQKKQILPIAFALRLGEVLSDIANNMSADSGLAAHIRHNLATCTLPDPDVEMSSREEDRPDEEMLDQQMMQEVTTQGRRAHNAPAPAPAAHLNEENLDELRAQMSKEQASVVKKIEDYLVSLERYQQAVIGRQRIETANRVISSRAGNVPDLPQEPNIPRLLIIGPGGTGKSFLIRILVLILRKRARARVTIEASPHGGCLLAAPTGIAAFNVGGSTLHHLFSLKVERRGANKYSSLSQGQLSTMKQAFKGVKLLIVDEISMMSSRVFDQVNTRLNQIMGTPGGFFGNLALCFVGDFAQLPPVCGLAIFDPRASNVLLYQRYFLPILLMISQRQRNDVRFAELLNRLRLGRPNDQDLLLLNSRSLEMTNPDREARREELTTSFADAIHLFAKKVMVEEHNRRKIRELARRTGQPVYRIRAADKINGGNTTAQIPADSDNTGGLLTELELTTGSQVWASLLSIIIKINVARHHQKGGEIGNQNITSSSSMLGVGDAQAQHRCQRRPLQWGERCRGQD